jgi:PIN domain nuclease of toxin-antitoxin system
LLEDEANIVLLSLVSIWEMQIKVQLGKLDIDLLLPEFIEEQRLENRLEILPIKLENIYALEHLPFHHKDPFDRRLIAQAQTENLMIVSNDPTFSNYQVSLIW